MSDRQRAYYVLASFDDYTDEARRISDFEEAAKALGGSYARQRQRLREMLEMHFGALYNDAEHAGDGD